MDRSKRLLGHILRLRRAERTAGLGAELYPIREDLEADLGATLSRSRAARLLGVSQTALDRWIEAGEVPTVITPSGRREVPRRFVVETAERIEELGQSAPLRRPLAAVLRQRRAGSEESGRESGEDVSRRRDSRGARGHLSAELRSLAYHRAIAERLDEQVLLEARGRLQRLKDEGRIHPRYAEQWRQVLSRPLLEIASLITRETPEWRDLRQDTPFAGVLTERERRRLIESVR